MLPPCFHERYGLKSCRTLTVTVSCSWVKICSRFWGSTRSYTLNIFLSHIGFEAPQSEVEFLRQRLNEEKEKSAKANRARLEAEARCHLAEKERDIYKLLALRWKGRRRAEANHQELGHENEMDQVEDAATAMVLGSRGSSSVLSLRNLFRRFRDYSEPFEEIDENEVDDEESLDASHTDRMDEDNDMIENEEDESSVSMNSERDLERASQVSETGDNYQSSNAMVVSRQVRTISITGEDI